MSIKLKYDPVGSSAMAAYDSGLGAGKERRDVRQQTFDLMEDRNNLIGGKRGGGFGGMPAGVAANPIAAKAWNEANNGIRMIENGRTFDGNIPATAIAHGRLTDRQRQIEEENPDPTPAEARAKNIFHVDPVTGAEIVVPPGTAPPPGAVPMWDAGDGKAPTPMKAPEPKDDVGKLILTEEIKKLYANSEMSDEERAMRIQKLQDDYEKKRAGAGVAAPGAAPAIPAIVQKAQALLKSLSNTGAPVPGAMLSAYNEAHGIVIEWQKQQESAAATAAATDILSPHGSMTVTSPGTAPAATGMGANPTPENTYPSPREGETPLQSAAHYQQWADQLRKGRRPIRPAARGGFLADFMRRHPTWDPTKVTDLQIMDELVWAYMNVARKAVSGYGEDSPEGNPAAMIGSGSTPLPTAAPPPAAGGTGAAPAAQPPMRNSGKAVEQDNRPQSVIVADKYLRRMRGMYGQNIPPEEAQAFQNAMSVLEAYESQL